MTTQARMGYGCHFKVGNGASPEVFTEIAEVTSLSLPSPTRDSIDVSHFLSPDSYREFIPGLIDAGEVTLEINYVPGSSTTALLLAEIEAQPGNKQIVFPLGEILTFTAFCTGFEGEAPIDDKMSASVTYKVSAKPSLVI